MLRIYAALVSIAVLVLLAYSLPRFMAGSLSARDAEYRTLVRVVDTQTERILGNAALAANRRERPAYIVRELRYDAPDEHMPRIIVLAPGDERRNIYWARRPEVQVEEFTDPTRRKVEIITAIPSGAGRDFAFPTFVFGASAPGGYSIVGLPAADGAIPDRAKLRRVVFGSLPEPTAPPPRVLSSVKSDGFTTTRLEFQSRRGHTFTAELHVPDKRGRVPGVVAIKGHDAFVDYSYLTRLTSEYGLVTICPSVNYHHAPKGDWSLTGERIRDCQIALAYLRGHEAVDAARIGCIGLSLGGQLSMFLAAVEPERVRVCVIGGYCPEYTFPADHVPDYTHNVLLTCRCDFIPGFGEAFTPTDVLCLIPPNTLIYDSGVRDRACPLATATTALARVRRGPGLIHVVHGRGHRLDDKTLELFAERLRSTTRPTP